MSCYSSAYERNTSFSYAYEPVFEDLFGVSSTTSPLSSSSRSSEASIDFSAYFTDHASPYTHVTSPSALSSRSKTPSFNLASPDPLQTTFGNPFKTHSYSSSTSSSYGFAYLSATQDTGRSSNRSRTASISRAPSPAPYSSTTTSPFDYGSYTTLKRDSTKLTSPKRQKRIKPEVIENPNQNLLEGSSYGPTSLPPQAYSGPSPFAPAEPIRKIYGSQMDRLPPIEAQLENIERGVNEILFSRGRRAIRDATLPGLDPIYPASYYTSSKSSSSGQNQKKDSFRFR